MKNTIDILKDLIKIPSYVEGQNNESEVFAYIKDFFIKLGDRYTFEEQKVEGNRKNLLVKNCKNPEIILFGHMDTVLPKNETVEPFNPRIIDEKLYGLGACDMKSGLAIMLSLALKNSKKGLGFFFTVDEEYEFKGAVTLVEKYTFNPKMIINIEPTNVEICNGCRGITEFSFKIHGKSMHSGRKQLGLNAIEKTVELTNKLQTEIAKYDNSTLGKNSLNLAYLHGGVLQEVDKNGNKKVSGLGMIVPNYAEVNCEIRVANKKVTTNFIKKQLNLIAKSIGVTVSDISFKFYLGSMFTEKAKLKEFEKSFKSINFPIKYRNLSTAGFYEIQLLQEKWGSNCIVVGPGPYEISHSANEFVDINSINNTEKIIESYINANL